MATSFKIALARGFVAAALTLGAGAAWAEQPIVSAPAAPAETREAAQQSGDAGPSVVLFAGAGFTEGSSVGFAGGVWAVNGFANDGLFFRLIGSVGGFDFDSAAAADGEAEALTYGGNLSVGYRLVFEQFAIAPFVGIQLFDRDIDPDAADTGQIDDSVGVIVGGRIDDANGADRFVWALDGNWSSVNSTFYVEAEAGYDFGRVDFGPTGSVFGNDEFTSARAGAFAKINVTDAVALKLTGGIQFADIGFENGEEDDDDDSAFGTISISVAY